MKTLRTAPFALLALVLALAVVGSSCSSANPVALQVGNWQLSNSDLQDEMSSFFDAYSKAAGQAAAEQSLQGTTAGTWSTAFTSQFLNDQLNLQLAQLALQNRGLEVTDTDRAAARDTLEKNYADQSGQSVFGTLTEGYQQVLIDGVAAQTVLQTELLKVGTTDEALRQIYDAGDTYTQPQACVSHILVFAGQPDGQTTPSDADYATALTEIEKVQSELNGTTDFAAVATASSQDTGSASKGGDLGCAPQGTYVQAFDDAVWSQPIGQVGPLVKSIYGYHLVLVRSRGVLSFDEAKGEIAQKVAASPETLLNIELAAVARNTTITVDGRYGQFDESTGQITTPAGPDQPSTTLAVQQLLGSAGQ